MDDQTRIDKWLWAVRICKTRSVAADACRNNRVLINGAFTKPSREVTVGDIVSVKRSPTVTFTYRVVSPVSSRVGPKLAADHAENITPQEELDKLNIPKHTIFVQRDPGTGRPTKRERREIDTLMDDFYYPDDMEE